MKSLILTFISVVYISVAGGTTLQSIFDLSGSGNGYDKYVTLSSDEIYTGGLGIFEGNVLIDGHGAIIDLQGGSGIWVYADEYYPANLDIQFCTIINGAYYGVSYGGTSTGALTNCNFVQNDFGIKLYDFSEVEIKNCNLIENTVYGVGIYSEFPVCEINYTNAWGNGEAAWMENCPG